MAPEPVEKLTSRRMEIEVPVKGKPIHDEETFGRTFHLSDGNGAVEFDDWRTGESCQLTIERSDLTLVGIGLGVKGGDRRLENVWSSAFELDSPAELGASFADLANIPEGSVLVPQQNEVSLSKASFTAGVADEHQCHQRVNLRLVRHKCGQCSAKPESFTGEFVAPAVTLIEDEIHHSQNRIESIVKKMVRRDTEGNAGSLDLALRSYKSLCHRCLGHEEGPCDFISRQAAERS